MDRVIIVSLTDITEQKKLEEKLLIQSETDFLTSICNRRSGEYRIEENMNKEKFGMFCLFDVDKFKFVNDNFGHAAGDALLVGIAKTMQKTFRTSDILIRLGGDEFVVFATGIQDEPLGSRVLDRFMGNMAAMEMFSFFHDDSTGNDYYACIIMDATACCSQGIEFVPTDDYTYPDDFPEQGGEICVVGVFDIYEEGENKYCTLRNATLT